MKILVAYDGSEEAGRAVDWAGNLARELDGSKVSVISIAPTLEAAPRIADAVDPTSNLERHRTQAEEARARLAKAGVTAELIVRAGNPAEEILNAVEDAFDVVVIGHRGISSARRFLMGSVSERVVRHASRPVLVIP